MNQPYRLESLLLVHHRTGSKQILIKRFSINPKKRIKQSRRYVRLLFSDRIDVRIPKADLPLFPDLESYPGRLLKVHGWPSRRKGHYSISVRHPSALVAVAGRENKPLVERPMPWKNLSIPQCSRKSVLMGG